MKSVKLSAIISVACLAVVIASAVLVGTMCKQADGTASIKKLLKACQNKSASAASEIFYGSIFYGVSYDSCVTVEDYLSESGIHFDYMKDESCKTQKIYVIGTADGVPADDEEISEQLSYLNTSADVVVAYVAADYTDAEGAEHTAITKVGALVNSDTGKINVIL